jgi:glutathione S-transferase
MTIRLYRHPLSGHSHRAELLLSLLRLPFEMVEINLGQREQKQPPHLARDPFGQIPVLEDGDVTIADSNAILVYLATRYDASGRWLPRDPVAAAQVQRWLGVAAGPLLDGPAKARVEVVFGRPRDPARHGIATDLFRILENHLTDRQHLVGAGPTIADVALYTYTSHAPEGGISLAPYPHLRAWLSRIEALPGFVGMKRSPDAPAAKAS